jgi:hypothetical protein
MSLQLRPDELLTALDRMEHPEFAGYLDQLLSLCDAMAYALAARTPNVEVNMVANYWDEMVCVPIMPIDATQPIPEHLKGLDDGGWE